MANSMRKRSASAVRKSCPVCLVLGMHLLLVFAPLVVASIRDCSSQQRFLVRRPFGVVLTQVPRCGGGDNGVENHGNDDDDDDDRTRFWSLSALFRLNANAKDDASTPPSQSPHWQRGNKRGGALAVRTSKSKTFVDVTPVSTASSRLLSNQHDDDGNGESLWEDDDDSADESFEHGIQEYTVQEGTDPVEIDEIEEIDALEEYDEDYEDDTLPSTLLSRPIKDGVDETAFEEETSAEGNVVESDAVTEEIMGAEDGRQATTDAVTSEMVSVDEAQVPEEEQIDLQDTARSEDKPTRAKGILQDASKFWWTNAWTEQAFDDVPDLEEVASDESDSDASVSVEAELVRKSENDEEAGDVLEVDIEVMDITTAEAAQAKEQESSAYSDEPTSQLMLQQKAIVDVVEETQILDGSLLIDNSEASRELASEAATSHTMVKESEAQVPRSETQESPFISSGYWNAIDKVASLGLSEVNYGWKLSRHLRRARKATARVTGLHGFLSQKGKQRATLPENAILPATDVDSLNDEDLGRIRRRIAAIEIAKQNVAKRAAETAASAERKRRGFFRRRRRRGRNRGNDLDTIVTAVSEELDESEISSMYLELEQKSLEEQLEEKRRKERVQEIDRIISKRQKDLLDLQCEKDALQRRPNPLYKYETAENGKTSRDFNFPPQELVDEYIDELIATGRLEKMNHTDLWKNGGGFDDEEDESIGDDLFVPSADARKLYERRTEKPSHGPTEAKSSNGNGGGGSWLLRQNLGKGGSLGEKIGEAVETAGYKAVCANVMSALARSIAAIHGVNIMTHSDIRLYMEQSPDLPPVGRNIIPGSTDAQNYAQEAIMDAMRKGVSKRKKRSSRSRRMQVEEAFLQRDAVVETLLSHCQISAPLLKLFPLSWQRALLGNIITLIAAVVSDFCDGIQLQILGHQLSFAFKPITESDMIRHIGMGGTAFNNRRARPEQFEAAIAATAEDVSESLQFLDRWHHRALGSGMLRAQIANLIARIVLTLADEVLSGAQMNLWSAQAGGPRMVAGLEYRASPEGPDKVM